MEETKIMKMSNTEFLREALLLPLRKADVFGKAVIAEINGVYFSAADIALPASKNDCTVYRLIIIEHFP